ncbi:MAG: hypothetical protein JSU65_06210 [Candidatus Zixiibacteriota bacterium]|nr:MAG: hypothetical protein JSU65_06210 [candidate division Zixibacteria bacterium]
MVRRLSLLILVLVCFSGCSSTPEPEPPGPIARSGTTPTIDGVFEEGEWNDAVVVQAGEYQQFMVKHDNSNLYFAFKGDGGDLFLERDTCFHLLHASAQLAWAVYSKSEDTIQSRHKSYDYKLWGLQDKPADSIKHLIESYLSENGWVASIGGTKRQTEFALSFDWLGIDTEAGEYAKIPNIYIYSGMLFAPGDPEIEKLMALSIEERKIQYPTLYWPSEPAPKDSFKKVFPDTVSFDPSTWGEIWIEL